MMQIILVGVGMAYFRLRARLYPDTSILMPPLLMVAAFSLLCEPVQRLFFNSGHAFEVLVMHSQCNLMLALAACGFRISFQRLAVLIAIFLTIFSCTISNAKGLIPITVLFAITAIGWLVLSWWETVDRRLVKTSETKRPLLWVGVYLALPLLLLLPSLGFGANSVTNALRGFMPSSGGSGSLDPFARGGINDGDALVAGNNNIKSFAPLDNAPFLDSDKPSLYDVFNDQFDEPPKKIKDQQKAIALPADLMKHIHQQMAEAKQAGREFTLVREDRKTDKQKIRDLNSPAMFYVAGHVPARFRLQVFDHFDGMTWYPIDQNKNQTESNQRNLFTELQKVEDRHWLKITPASKAFEIHNGTATHSLKIANLDGNTIPSPPQLIAINIAHVNRKDMYHVAKSGIASLQRKSVPAMTPINVVSQYVDRDQLTEWPVLFATANTVDVTRVLPQSESTDAIRRLAKTWTKNLPRGWQQIAAIEQKLRTHCILDREANLDSKSLDPVVDFLFRARRGPEYLFAASAACLLRSLDYQARLVGGFYAPSENYDSRKQHTAVFDQNAHFWCEAGIGMGAWITVEASPGYQVSAPPPGFIKRIWNQLVSFSLFVAEHTVLFLFAGTILLLTWVFKGDLIAVALTAYWKLQAHRSLHEQAAKLGALIERRLELAKLNQNATSTLRRRAQQTVFNAVRADLIQVANIADFAAFAGTEAKPQSICDRRELDRLASSLSYRRLRKLPNMELSQHI